MTGQTSKYFDVDAKSDFKIDFAQKIELIMLFTLNRFML